MSGGNSVGKGKTSGNLSNGVGISIRVSGPLAKVVDSSVSNSVVGSNSMVGRVGVEDVVGGVRGVGNISGVVSMSGGNSVGEGKTSGNLSDGVGISIRVSGPLAEVVDSSVSNSVVGSNSMVGSIGVVHIVGGV